MQPSDAAHPNPRLAAKLAAIFQRRGGPTVDLTIRPAYYALLRELGNPQEHLPPVIHVAGTNGKGSTIAIMRACLEAAGHHVHVYTSPHLIRFNERIVLAGREIADDALEALLDEVMAKDSAADQTFFELTTAVAFTAFARTPADILLLETGLGGRLDSTNVVTHPVVTVITPIGDDHREFLGDTLTAIAGEKAGIMKAGVPCVIAGQDEAAVDAVFAEWAAEFGCRLYRAEHEWFCESLPPTSGGKVGWGGLSAADQSRLRQPVEPPPHPTFPPKWGEGFEMMFAFQNHETTLPHPALPGAHQIANAGVALAALELCGLKISDEARAHGLRTVHWPARLQRLRDPAPGWELWLDGAHNGHGAKALAAQISAWRAADGRPVHLILGMLARKDADAILGPLAPVVDSVALVPVPGENSHTLATVAAMPKLRETAGFDVAIAALTKTALEGRIIVAGSLYLAASVLSAQ